MDHRDEGTEDVLVDYEADDDEDVHEYSRNDTSLDLTPDRKGNDGMKADGNENLTPNKIEFSNGGANNDPTRKSDLPGPSKFASIDDKKHAKIQKSASSTVAVASRADSGLVPGPRTSISNFNRGAITSGNSSYGVYIPPFRRKQLEQQQLEQGEEPSELMKDQQSSQITNPSVQVQRQKWEELKKQINGTVNRLNNNTIKDLIHKLFQTANLIRGKGLLARAVLRAATTSPTYAPVYASLIAVLNTKLPEIGELVLVRSILTFRKSYARQDRGTTMSITNFMACLFNQGLCHELLCLQLLTILLEGDPTDDSVEVAVQFTKVVGMALVESSPAGVHAVMERFRGLLHDGRIGRRVQYKIEELMKIRRSRFKDFPALQEELDLVEREEQITFEIGLDDEGLQKEDALDVFKYDPEWNENENDWIDIRKEVLGDDSDDEESSDGNGSETEDSDNEDDSDDDDEDGVLPGAVVAAVPNNKQITEIHDMSEKDLIHLRRTIYLTIMSSATFEECSHKLSKMDIPMGKEMELINMIIECCSQERTFLRYYGLIAARFCLMNKRWSDAFHEAFVVQYNTVHRLETNKLRNVAKLFAHLLHTDSLSWSCLSVIHLNEDETTSSSRIFLKILVQEMAEAIGIGTLVSRFETDDPEVMEWYKELFPKDHPRKTKYAINFFTSIGLGPLTDGLREHLKNAPKLIMMQAEAEAAKLKAIKDADSDESSVLSESSSSSSSVSSSSLSSSSSSSGSYSSYSSYSSSTSSYTSSSDESSSRGRRRKGTRRHKGKGKSKRDSRGRTRSYSSDSTVTSYSRSSISRSPSQKRSERSTKRSRSRSRSRRSSISNREERDFNKKDTKSTVKGKRKTEDRTSKSFSRSPSPKERKGDNRGERSKQDRRRSRKRSRSYSFSSDSRRSRSRSGSSSRGENRSTKHRRKDERKVRSSSRSAPRERTSP